MEVVYSSASRMGGAGLSNVVNHAVNAIYAAGHLKKAIVYGNRQDTVPSSVIKVVRFQPTKIFSSLSSRYYYSMKRMWLDHVASRFIAREGCDIFHGWTHECLKSIGEARRHGALTIVERGYCHPLYSKKTLDEEYEKWGMTRHPKGKNILKRFDHWHREESTALEEFEAADYVFINSSFVKETFLQYGFPERKLVMLPRGVDIDDYKPASGKKDKTFRIIFVGTLNIRKGVQYLLEAWKRLDLANAELLLIGSVADELGPILKKYNSDDRIKIKGFVKNPSELFSRASIFVFPTLDEGSAKVTYEAMACGLPVVTTPNAGSLVSDGTDGFIVGIRDVEALKEKILFFYNNPDAVREMGALARKHIEPFTWEKYEKDLIDTYLKLWKRE
jgi:glycosyltransferase involved in cell wall biosynthesis